MGLKAVSSYDIIERSEEFMIRLRDEVGESVMIGALLDKEVILIKQIQGSHDFVFALKDGMRFNLYSTAPGKVLLAYMKPRKQRFKLAAIHEINESRKKQLKEELDRIVKDGYALDLNETVEGVHCIGAPIFDETGEAIACIWTSGPAGRLPGVKIKEIALLVRQAGREISRNIGYIPGKE